MNILRACQRAIYAFMVLLMTLTSGCMKWDYGEKAEDFNVAGSGLFICNEGNFQYSNATLSYYNPDTREVENEVFFRANGYRLGDVAQSMTIYDGRGWVVVNNSNIVWAIDPVTFKEVGRIENLTAPRYIHFVNAHKAYVTQLWDNRIFIVDPATYSVTGHITVPDMTMESGSTEQMVQYGKWVYCTCWSYQNRILKIDTETDMVVEQLEVGIQPNSIVLDNNAKLWVLTDGGLEGSPYGYEAATLVKIDAETMQVERRFKFRLGDSPHSLTINGTGDKIYWINNDVMEMEVTSNRLPVKPLVKSIDTKYYGLTIDPVNNEIYVADAIDYQQQGIIYRYTPQGNLIDQFYAGITPGAFCWTSYNAECRMQNAEFRMQNAEFRMQNSECRIK